MTREPGFRQSLAAQRKIARIGFFSLISAIATIGSCDAQAEEMAIEPRFDAAGLFHEGVAPVKTGKLWGFIDRNGRFVVEPKYDDVKKGADGRFGVRTGDRWGFITTTGREVVDPRFDEIKPFSDGSAAVRVSGLWGYIAPDGKFLHSPRFSMAAPSSDGLSLVVENGSLKVFSQYAHSVPVSYSADGREIERVWKFSEGLGVVQMGNARYYISTETASIAAGGYRYARGFSEGMAAVQTEDKRWIFIDQQGKLAIRSRFDGARDFSNGVAPVARKGKWGYIDKRGSFVLKPSYDRAYSFADGYAVIRNGEKRGFLEIKDDGSISVYVAPRFEDVFRFTEGLAPVKIDGSWGYLTARRQPTKSKVRGITELGPGG